MRFPETFIKTRPQVLELICKQANAHHQLHDILGGGNEGGGRFH